MWGRRKGTVRHVRLDDLKILVVAVEGAVAVGDMMSGFAKIRADNPDAIEHRVILDLRRWNGGALGDDALAEYFGKTGVMQRLGQPGEPEQITMIYLANRDTTTQWFRSQIESVTRGRYKTIEFDDAEAAWRHLAPDHEMPPSVRRLLL